MFIAGDSWYGRVDRVRGLFHVKTRFLHVWWVPVVPRESWLVDDASGKQGRLIQMSWKSVFVAWTRTATGCLFVFIGLMLVPIFEADPKKTTVSPWVSAGIILAILAALAGVYALTYRWARPSEQRARELAKLVGLDPDEVAERFRPDEFGEPRNHE